LVNDFAVRSFRDIGDGDYIAARMACRAALVTQFLWASQQAVEKYLKCVLLLNPVKAKKVRHDLRAALGKIKGSGKVSLKLTQGTEEFIGGKK
jgi:HEPN domain-containing protein